MYTHTHLFIHTHTQIYTHSYIQTHTCTHTHTLMVLSCQASGVSGGCSRTTGLQGEFCGGDGPLGELLSLVLHSTCWFLSKPQLVLTSLSPRPPSTPTPSPLLGKQHGCWIYKVYYCQFNRWSSNGRPDTVVHSLLMLLKAPPRLLWNTFTSRR